MANLKYSELKPIVEEYGGLILDQVYDKLGTDQLSKNKQDPQTKDNSQQEIQGDDNFNLDDIKKVVSKNQAKKKKQSQFEQLFGSQNDLVGKDAIKNAEQQDNSSNIEDAKRSKFVFKQIQLVDLTCNILSFMSMVLAVLEYDIRFRKLKESAINPILYLISMQTIMLLIAIYIKYGYELKLLKEQKSVSETDTIKSSGIYKTMLFEFLVIIIHPNVLTKDISISIRNAVTKDDVIYQLNDFLGIFVLLRIYMVIRGLLNFSMFASPRACRLCKMYGADGGKFFAIKSIMNEQPLKVVILYFIVSLFVLGHWVRVCEESYNESFGYYWNCFWLIIITMTTVGYGDFFPKCLPGRVTILITCIWGASLVSLLVVALTNTLNMDISESKAHNVILRLTERKQLHKEAAWVLTSAAKTSFIRKKQDLNPRTNPQDKKLVQGRLQIIQSHAENFKQVARKIKSMYDVSNLSEEMARYFDYLKDELKTIQENQILLKDYLLKLKSTKQQTQQNINKNAEFIAKFSQEDAKMDQLFD